MCQCHNYFAMLGIKKGPSDKMNLFSSDKFHDKNYLK